MNQHSIRSFQNHYPTLGARVFVDQSAVVTGKVILGDDVSIWPGVSVRGDLLPITIGEGSNIQDCSALHTTRKSAYHPEGFPLTIGRWVTVGHSATLHGCTIHDGSLIGMGAIVLDGAVIESQVLVGAGTLVPPGKRLQSGYLYVGNPVKQMRLLKPEELLFLQQSPRDYILLKNQHLESLAQGGK